MKTNEITVNHTTGRYEMLLENGKIATGLNIEILFTCAHKLRNEGI